MLRFDRIILAIVLALGLTVAALSVAAARLGPTVDSITTAQTLDGTSVNTEIGLTFTESMIISSVERNFQLTPRVPGDFTWSGNELVYIPRRPLAYGTRYTVQVRSAARGKSGKRLFRTFEASFTTQAQHLLYLGAAGGQQNRLVLASIGGKQETVGRDDGLITEFSLSFDRSLVVYIKRGAQHERPDEIWLLSLADNSTQLVFRRPDWDISAPHFSPDGHSIVFLATNVRLCVKYYGCYRDTSGPVIELLDLRSHQVSAFKSKSDVPITNFIDFSPAGQLAYTDLGSALTLADPSGTHVVHIPNRNNSLEFWGFDSAGDKASFVGQTPDSSGGDVLVYTNRTGNYLDASHGIYDSSTPSFSTSGNEVAYAAYRGERGIEPVYGINIYDFRTHRTMRLTGERVWSDWAPQWSLDDRYVAFVRSEPQEAMYMGSGEIWVARSDGSDAHPIGGTGSNVRWVS